MWQWWLGVETEDDPYADMYEDGESEMRSESDPEIFMGFEEGYVEEGGEEESLFSPISPCMDYDDGSDTSGGGGGGALCG